VSGGGPPLDVQRFLRLFLEEAADHLATLEGGLLRLEENPAGQGELIDEVFRAAHSIKGASATFGLQEIARLTHAMESLLDRMRTGELRAGRELTSALLSATDHLGALLTAAREGTGAPEGAAAVEVELQRLLAAGPAPATEPAAAPMDTPGRAGADSTEYEIRFRCDENAFRKGLDPLLVLRELSERGEILESRADSGRLPPLAELNPERCHLAWTLRLRSSESEGQLREAFTFVEDGSDIEIRAAASPAEAAPTAVRARAVTADASTIRVSIDKVDRLINLVGELVIAQSMISQVVSEFSIDKLTRLQEAVGEMERNTRELQERVMAVRMVPLSVVFNRVPRLVRDLAEALGKKVTVQIRGGETEIDRSVIEQIGDPLTHLVRNAIDHGIEGPEDRQGSGKPEVGTVTLSAFHQGGNVVIHIEDDGRGLDAEKIRRKAIAQGLVDADEELSTEAITQLIFRPGFSTAEVVSDVSGRGVGMDVVRTNIEALNGQIALESQPGRGTRFRISLPLTLAIVEGLSVGLGDEVYVIPLVSIAESLRPRPGDIKTIAGRGEVVTVRGRVMPLLRLRRLLAVPGRRERTGEGIVVILENQGQAVGLMVDDILGQSQVVIKNLEANFRRVEGVMGATILGDGKVALILDVQGVARIAHGTPGGVPAVRNAA
jgi:two-component system, chemotaxis family, sensor kinase CheA